MTNKQFPKDFIFGTALASYQVEGGIYNNDWTTGKTKILLFALNHATRHVNIMSITRKILNC